MAKKRGKKRYDAAKKQEIINFIEDYDKKNGRGGQAEAASKYGVSVNSLSRWMNSDEKSKKKGSSKSGTSKEQKTLNRMLDIQSKITDLKKQISKLESEYNKLKKQL